MSPWAGEVIGFLGLAMAERVPIAHLRELIYPCPTFVRWRRGCAAATRVVIVPSPAARLRPYR
jgi:hypothetical protein